MVSPEEDVRLRWLLQQGYGPACPQEDFVQQLRKKLQQELANRSAPLPQAALAVNGHRNPWAWMGGFTMRQRIVAGSVGIVIVLGLLVLWEGSLPRSASAMEQLGKMAENIRQAKSYRYDVTVRNADDAPQTYQMIGKAYWQAPGSVRIESTFPQQGNGAGPQGVSIYPHGKPGLHIFHPDKTYKRLEVYVKTPLSSGSDDLVHLGRFSGQAERQLGNQTIDGRTVHGFLLDNAKVWPKGPAGSVEVWLDTETDLPLRVRQETLMAKRHMITEFTNIRWNLELDPQLFDTTPPTGYSDTTPPALSHEEQVQQIRQALTLYAEAAGQRYPKRIPNTPDVEEYHQLLGFSNWPTDPGARAKTTKVAQGFERILRIVSTCAEFAYHGDTVSPQDKQKVLMRWKWNDGSYQVLFGDLHDQTASEAEVHQWEAKE